ncbi:hypothetical protein ET475_16685 [Microbacterium protaetiae]|uniref:VOC family protein n=1 Tax=Microbacterium protaetiae TaxID=2509458 RepID=A0A4P6EJH9_9MICO|nr:hypothetical protein [Microbacterium protaetiae]QAY61439.1 hypothetical protein ET475_16685 [Microbacterium protaetiae]
MAVTVQAIQYTAHPAQWRELAVALGLVPAFDPGEVWSELDGDGILAVHKVDAADPLAGTTDIHVLVDDLDATEAALVPLAVSVMRTTVDEVGPLLTATTSTGAKVSASTGARTAAGEILVQPIWYDTDAGIVRPILQALGLRPRIGSDSGTWLDFVAPGGGSVAFHAASEAGTVLGMEYTGDLDALARRLAASGHSSEVVDEAYNRTLLVETPEGTSLWINGRITDMYGYRRLDAG